MVTTLTRNNLCDSESQWIKAAEQIIYETVISFRQRGLRRDAAIEQASLALGITPRRTWSIFYDQPFAMPRKEYERLKKNFAAHLEAEAIDLARRADAARLRRQQIELDLG